MGDGYGGARLPNSRSALAKVQTFNGSQACYADLRAKPILTLVMLEDVIPSNLGRFCLPQPRTALGPQLGEGFGGMTRVRREILILRRMPFGRLEPRPTKISYI